MKRGVNYILKKLYPFVGEIFLEQDGSAFKRSLFPARQPVSFMNIVAGENSMFVRDFSLSLLFILIIRNGERHFESNYAWVNNFYCLESKSPIIYSRRLGSGDRLQQ